jgi:hypothetical protein
MARFFVGQRVRVVNAALATEAIGREAQVTGALRSVYSTECGHYDGYPCAVDGIGECRSDGRSYCFIADFLEPIQPEGHKPSEFTTLRDLMDSLEGVRA